MDPKTIPGLILGGLLAEFGPAAVHPPPARVLQQKTVLDLAGGNLYHLQQKITHTETQKNGYRLLTNAEKKVRLHRTPQGSAAHATRCGNPPHQAAKAAIRGHVSGFLFVPTPKLKFLAGGGEISIR